jgi:hypothetical protein
MLCLRGLPEKMKYQVMFDAVPIHCETASQAVALAKEISLTRRVRSNGAPHSDEDGAPLFNGIASLGSGGRRLANALVQHPDGLSADKLSAELGFKKPTDIEGAVSAMKGFLKRRNLVFSDVIEESTQGERTFRIRSAVFNLVKKALEVQ